MREEWREVVDALLESRQGLDPENALCLVSDGRRGENADSKSTPGIGFGVMGNQQLRMLSFFFFFGFDSFCPWYKIHKEK